MAWCVPYVGEVMDACMGELRRSRHVDVSELTVEAGLFKSFDRILQRQLDPVWHMAGTRGGGHGTGGRGGCRGAGAECEGGCILC